ncbi:MAG: class II aldolase/adducin family protein [Anaerolineae bacterium]|nr:class II aldolase/adducin family protein [Anaerolineae bacterium]
MKFTLLHPREQIVATMRRIYGYGMTTTSGGNLSILDDNGDIWITPAGIDKGALKSEDIVCVSPTGAVKGIHKPSSEYPFHRAIYNQRSDFNAIVHAHPSALVSFSIVRSIPNTRVIPQALAVCGEVGYAPYALPGSGVLGEEIAKTFSKGFGVVLLENHGVVAGGKDLSHAFQRFETLDFCARILIDAHVLGETTSLSDDQILKSYRRGGKLKTFKPQSHSSYERELRMKICDVVHRAYKQRLMTSTGGTVSARVNDESFLITPHGIDRMFLDIEDVVLIRNGERERRKRPSRSVNLHKTIYNDHPDIYAVITTQAPSATAFSVTGQKLDTRTIPESYLVLRDIPLIKYGSQYGKGKSLSAVLASDVPVVLLENDAILTTGQDLPQAFDRLEVAEFSARALIYSTQIGSLKPIGPQALEELEKAFLI